jgi:hypothetical protein
MSMPPDSLISKTSQLFEVDVEFKELVCFRRKMNGRTRREQGFDLLIVRRLLALAAYGGTVMAGEVN